MTLTPFDVTWVCIRRVYRLHPARDNPEFPKQCSLLNTGLILAEWQRTSV